MQIARTVPEVRAAIQELKKRRGDEEATVGFVPTMGYLHEGHASLLRKARSENGIAMLSIFVNPLQFGPNEDFSRYPRDEERDLQVARDNGVDLVFLPDVSAMYPKTVKTKVAVAEVTDLLCGASRPGHFDGVSTVVTKLFNIIQPDRAYFGMKDAQQVAVIERMTEDLNVPVQIVPCPIVRESDGLALSSRNVYLSGEERRQALVLSQSLQLAEGWLAECGGDYRSVKALIEAHIRTSPLADIDYVEIMDYPSIRPAYDLPSTELEGTRLLIALAVRFGRTRLIDNRLFQI
ncbi:pantoate--beta-alanine ligase [Gorillibacterium sp. sgz5001074]|uniref:pantoate--beta-alanine ligase n=1 Tax=Gorillibacterium sp. sgz5001074 TaxID=3446695 RepID=UPI003F67FC39